MLVIYIKKKEEKTRLALRAISSLGNTLYISKESFRCYTLCLVVAQLPLKTVLGIIGQKQALISSVTTIVSEKEDGCINCCTNQSKYQ